MDRGGAFDRLRHHLEGGPAAGVARQRPAIDAQIEEFLHARRVDHRDAGIHEGVFRLMRRGRRLAGVVVRSEEHTSELQSLMRISYAVFCLKKKTNLYIAHIPSTEYI